MDISYVFIGLLLLALLLFILSFFQKDPFRLLQEEFEQFTLQQMQENYQIQKKLKVLEEELLITDDHLGAPLQNQNEKLTINEIIKNQVLALAKQGASLEQISRQSSLTIEEVQAILTSYGLRGHRNE